MDTEIANAVKTADKEAPFWAVTAGRAGQTFRKEVDSMCSLGQEIREQGRMEGRTEGVAEIIMNMYQTGFSLKQIADIAKKTTDEVKAIVETKKTVLS